ncbi:hypothetical protein TpMuguga_04g00569 [Theileria parva strain Muguga]|uniref:Uncharacterized protein n=1 Tax=Theileria parva TaxID=5875 RepID=Q4N208_THEPA|nr:uncharacterized protein TpMuguga_04g00569 [Theileria parva strain Muguga]EAN31921.1 hypothetical protein TpMuguga_04g00569 [Theileria parva strain Muguga]|eukprot:XP_764204.1 hypothetical protein [Theileria parva strain Muguga]
MSAGLIWERCRLNDELSKLIAVPNYNTNSYNHNYYCNNLQYDGVRDEARCVLGSTNCFRNDIYSLPPGVDSKVTNLYPLLHQIYDESHALSEYDLQKLAHNILNNNYPQNQLNFTQYRDSNTHYRDSYPQYRDSTCYREYLDGMGGYKTPTSVFRNILNDYRPYDTNGVSDPRGSNFTSYTRPTNLFNTNLTTIQSQSETPEYLNRVDNVNLDIPAAIPVDTMDVNPNTMENLSVDKVNNMFNTPNYLNSVNYTDNLPYHRNNEYRPYDQRTNEYRGYDQRTDYRVYDKPDYGYEMYNSVERSVDEFRKAFQPGNEYRNEYTTVETPIADTTRVNENYNDEFVSSFPFEKSLNNYFHNDYYDHFQGYNRDMRMDAGVNFNPNSPLKSMMNDDYQYNYHTYVTPQRPFY